MHESKIDYRYAFLAVDVLSGGGVERAEGVLLGSGDEDARVAMLLHHYFAAPLHAALALALAFTFTLALALAAFAVALAALTPAFAATLALQNRWESY